MFGIHNLGRMMGALGSRFVYLDIMGSVEVHACSATGIIMGMITSVLTFFFFFFFSFTSR